MRGGGGHRSRGGAASFRKRLREDWQGHGRERLQKTATDRVTLERGDRVIGAM
jgi:hypothetical protein